MSHHEIYFYQDADGNEPVNEYIESLRARQDKDSRIKYNKILDYVGILREYGTLAGEPYIKHLEGEIWELRPIRDRILFAGWLGGSFVLLHSFLKKTQKTPIREIEKAKREFEDFKDRWKDNDSKERV